LEISQRFLISPFYPQCTLVSILRSAGSTSLGGKYFRGGTRSAIFQNTKIEIVKKNLK
jgi:hypothetical protein